MTTTTTSSGGAGYEALAAAATKAVAGEAGKRPYYGKCQYKTGKCFNERTLKRNGDAHSLCEEHRIKQNLIQRRSDRKYQTVHAIRRRERSQRRAVLKKQVSMAVAQQLFFEHQQQKSLGGLPLHLLTSGLSSGSPRHQPELAPGASIANPGSLVPPIQIPASAPMAPSLPTPALLPFSVPHTAPVDGRSAAFVDASASFVKSEQPQPHRAQLAGCKPGDESSPTGIDDFAPDSFLNVAAEASASRRGASGSARQQDQDEEELELELGEEVLGLGEDFAPIVSCRGERELWTDEDIEFLQTLLLP
jgi:hypothetical protein